MRRIAPTPLVTLVPDCGCAPRERALVAVDGARTERRGVVVHEFRPPEGHAVAWTRFDSTRYFRVMPPHALLQLLEVSDDVVVAEIEPPEGAVRAVLTVTPKEASREPLILIP